MRLILQHVHGNLFQADGRAALLLKNSAPESVTDDSCYLCFAVVVQGPEDHILPALVLDDWGNQRRDLAVYEWLEEEGHRFPRSEIFGFDVDGSEAQCFLRALELYVKLPCYFFPTKKTPVAEGVRLNAVLLPDAAVDAPQKIKRPSQFEWPLGKAKVSWWQVHADSTSFDFSLLNKA